MSGAGCRAPSETSPPGDDGNASLHVHIVLGLSDGSTRGEHLLQEARSFTQHLKSSRRKRRRNSDGANGPVLALR